MQQPVSFTEGSVARVLYVMSMPMVWGLLATMSFNAVDTFFVAQLGDAALAAMGFTFPVVMGVTSLAIGLGAGTSSVIARTLGAGQPGQAKQLASDTMIFALLISLVVIALGLATIEPLFLLLGASPELIPMISEYMVIWYVNVPLVLVFMVISALLRSSGNSKTAGNMMLFSALANVCLDPLLIFGWGPIPRMEIAGAAMATLIVRAVMMVAGLYYIYWRLGLAASPHKKLADLLNSCREVMRIGLPAMGTNMIIPFATGITVSLIAAHGANAVGGFGVAMRIEPMALIVFYALSSVIGPFFGQNLKKPERQLEAVRVLVRFCLVFGVVMAILLGLGAPILIGWFSDNPQVVAVASSYFLMVPISYGCYGLIMSVNATFNGMGKPMPAMIISIMRVLAVYLPLALLLQYFWALQGLFMATALVNILMGGIAYFWLMRDVKHLQQA